MAVMDRRQLVTLFSRSKAGKAFGEDCLPVEAFKCMPELMAQVYMPVMIKASARVEEPLHWKGGSL
eukprot:1541393-Alexandrium_andersonii.AAC.1